MTQVKINTALGGHAAGDVIEVSPKAATYLVGSGNAEPIEPEPEPRAKAVRSRPRSDAQPE